MFASKAKDLELVIVIWEDAAVGFEDDKPENVKAGKCVNHTCGWLLRKTRSDLVLVWDVSPDDGTVRFTYTIPRKLVIKILRTGVLASHRSLVPEATPPQS